MLLRLSCTFYFLIAGCVLSGCAPTAEICTAIFYQRAGIDFKTYSSGNWTFEGLDTRIQPRCRSGFYSTNVSLTPFPDPNNLGEHSYCRNSSEKIGVVYTSRAGHIDLGHVRKMADWTGYLSAKILERIEHGENEYCFKLYEPSEYYVKITYPENWKNYSEEEREIIAREVSINLGMYLAYNAGVWHEILTWFDYKPKEIFSDFESAFAWEDIYSNLLGILLAEKALHNDEKDFSSSITLYLDEAMRDLGVQSTERALSITNRVKNKWFANKFFFPQVYIRNLDIGLNDGRITPCRIEDAPVCQNAEIKLLPLPDWDISKYGFSVKLEIEPREWEKNKILKVAYPDKKDRKKRIEPGIHYPVLMQYIEEEAKKRKDVPFIQSDT